MVDAGMNGNVQGVMNASVNGAAGIASGYDMATAAGIQNAGGQIVNASGQIQNGNYIGAVQNAG